MLLYIFSNFLAANAAKNCEEKVVIQSAPSAASLCGGRASGRLDFGFVFAIVVAVAAKTKNTLIIGLCLTGAVHLQTLAFQGEATDHNSCALSKRTNEIVSRIPEPLSIHWIDPTSSEIKTFLLPVRR